MIISSSDMGWIGMNMEEALMGCGKLSSDT